MREPTINDVTKVVKKALAEKYGRKIVSVTHGTGTAYGWVTATLNLGIPMQDILARREVASEAYAIARDAVKKAGLRFHTYCDDCNLLDQDQFTINVK